MMRWKKLNGYVHGFQLNYLISRLFDEKNVIKYFLDLSNYSALWSFARYKFDKI